MSAYEKFYLTQERQFKLFDDALIVFDTSALLDLYYYSEKTQDSIFNTVFEYFKERLWIPERVEKLFNSEEIEVQVGYVEDDNFVSVMHNNLVI